MKPLTTAIVLAVGIPAGSFAASSGSPIRALAICIAAFGIALILAWWEAASKLEALPGPSELMKGAERNAQRARDAVRTHRNRTREDHKTGLVAGDCMYGWDTDGYRDGDYIIRLGWLFMLSSGVWTALIPYVSGLGLEGNIKAFSEWEERQFGHRVLSNGSYVHVAGTYRGISSSDGAARDVLIDGAVAKAGDPVGPGSRIELAPADQWTPEQLAQIERRVPGARDRIAEALDDARIGGTGIVRMSSDGVERVDPREVTTDFGVGLSSDSASGDTKPDPTL